tara:strand:- start:852 stop:1742 length:891 start_codon:yes stop_codon:yes gene_type:complete
MVNTKIIGRDSTNHHSEVKVENGILNTGIDTSDTGFLTLAGYIDDVETKLTNIQTINDTKLSGIQGTLTDAEVHLSAMDTNITITRDNIAAMKIFNQDAELHLSALDTNFSSRIPTTIGPKDEALSFTICRNNTTGAFDNFCRTDITDRGTSKALKCNDLGSQIVEEAPTIYASPTTLGNTNRLDNSASSGLSDTIDMNGFRNCSFSVKYTADSGQDFSSPLKYIYVFASFDNSEFFNTGSSVELAEHNISGSSGTYRGFGFISNVGARYLKLGGNVGGTNFSACEVKFAQSNGGF